jgi:hypothetical protein
MKNLGIQDGKIILSGNRVFPLTIDDLFLLDLPSLTSNEPQTITEEEIIIELEE